MMIKKFLGIALLSLLFININAQTAVEKVEASFIASFMRYIRWPQQESMKTFTVGVYGNSHAILNELNSTVNGKSIGFAKINVVEVSSVEDMKKCQVLFIPKGKSGRLKKDLDQLGNHAVMTVTEEQAYTPSYSIINFKIVDNKLTFQLNNEIAEQRNIVVSNKLAQMARN